MPIFDYTCPDGHTQEVYLKMNEEKPKSVKCGKMSCRKKAVYKISAPKAFIWDCKPFH